MAKGDIRSANIILNHIENNISYNDSLNKHCWVITTTKNKIFTPQISAYKVLESKGIDIINNDQLKKQILDLYNIDYPTLGYEYENYHQNIHDYGRPIARSLFITGNNETLKPIDYKSLYSNVEFINVLKLIISNDNAIDEMLRDLIEKCQEIENAIDIELRK